MTFLCPSPTVEHVFFPTVMAKEKRMINGSWYEFTFYANRMYTS